MPYLLNASYLFLLLVLSPWIVYKSITTGKYRRGLARKFFGLVPCRESGAPCAWFHGVSLGEIYLLRTIVAEVRSRHTEWDCVISTTTDTGFAEAKKAFPDLSVIYWPLDFTWAVSRALRAIRPSLVVLAEGEIWPNFLSLAHRRGIPVVIVNARISPRSAKRYRWLGRHVFRNVSAVGAQTEAYAALYRRLGVPAERVHVTGSVKYDGAVTERGHLRVQAFREVFQISQNDVIWVAGSTQAPEEEIVLRIFERLRNGFPNLRLFIVPRQKDRFEEVARLLDRSSVEYIRRSKQTSPGLAPVTLVDTIGELAWLWGLADIAFVGGSMDGKRGGQNMIEPAAFGAAVVFGSHVWSFAETARRLLEGGGAIQIQDEEELGHVMKQLVVNRNERRGIGARGRQLVIAQQAQPAGQFNFSAH